MPNFLTQSCGSHLISGKGNHVLVDLQTWHLHLFLIYFCCGCHRLAFMCLVWKCVVLIELTLSQQAVVMALQLFDNTCLSHVLWKHRGQLRVRVTVMGLEKMFSPFDRVISLNMTWDVKVQLALHTSSHSYTYTHAHTHMHTSIHTLVHTACCEHTDKRS